MGYRIYIGSISKEKAMVLSKLQSEKQVLELCEDDYVCGRDLLDKDSLLEFGSYIEWVKPLQDRFCAKLLLNYATCDQFYNEHAFFAIDQKGFLEILKYYDKKILENYQDLMKIISKPNKDISLDDFNELHEYFYSKLQEWGGGRFKKGNGPYCLDNEKVTSSWKYEYAQFELARVYKNFDFDNNHMVVHGW